MDDAPNTKMDRYPLPAVHEGLVSEAEANPVREKSFAFALSIIELCREMHQSREYVISKQLMKSGTAIGANVEEAVSAESRKDFLHKMNLALKEARESLYWLRLLDASGIAPRADLSAHLDASDELVRILVAITRTVRNT